jgi:hypothetical protein
VHTQGAIVARSDGQPGHLNGTNRKDASGHLLRYSTSTHRSSSRVLCQHVRMAIPTVFVSSTFYDLRYAREALKRFIEVIGYAPVLSEDGTVFFDPTTTAAESCLREVSNANLFVLLVGGRYGSVPPAANLSVTNGEFLRAVEQKIPIFALVEQGTYNDYTLYQANVSRPDLLTQLSFPHSDSMKIFEFIHSVQSRVVNNALVPFQTSADIEAYLRLQWAGMMHSYVSSDARAAQVADTLTVLTQVNERVELIAAQILRAVGSPLDSVYVALLQAMIQSPIVADLRYIGGNPTPGTICISKDVAACAKALGAKLVSRPARDEHEDSISGSGSVTPMRMKRMVSSYRDLRNELLEKLRWSGTEISDIVDYEKGLGAVVSPPIATEA